MVHNLKMYCECLYTVKQNIRNFSGSATLLSKNNKNHYDSLGLTSKATQADVKSAYYKLSMRYHPDKNKGSEEASKQFRDISEAYEVLGNVKLRRMYDKGEIISSDFFVTLQETFYRFIYRRYSSFTTSTLSTRSENGILQITRKTHKTSATRRSNADIWFRWMV